MLLVNLLAFEFWKLLWLPIEISIVCFIFIVLLSIYRKEENKLLDGRVRRCSFVLRWFQLRRHRVTKYKSTNYFTMITPGRRPFKEAALTNNKFICNWNISLRFDFDCWSMIGRKEFWNKCVACTMNLNKSIFFFLRLIIYKDTKAPIVGSLMLFMWCRVFFKFTLQDLASLLFCGLWRLEGG